MTIKVTPHTHPNRFLSTLQQNYEPATPYRCTAVVRTPHQAQVNPRSSIRDSAASFRMCPGQQVTNASSGTLQNTTRNAWEALPHERDRPLYIQHGCPTNYHVCPCSCTLVLARHRLTIDLSLSTSIGNEPFAAGTGQRKH